MRHRVEAGFMAAAAGMALCSSVRAQFYEYKVIAKVGQAQLTGMESGVSINDDAQVAFVGQTAGVDNSKEGVFYGDGTKDPQNVSPSITVDQMNIYPTLQINNAGKIVVRTQQPNPNGGFAITRIWRWDIKTPDQAVEVASAVDDKTPFRSVSPNPSINNQDTTVFSALDKDVKHQLCTGLPGGYTIVQLPKSPVFPMISDGGETALKWGINPADPIHLRDASLNLAATIATSPDFSSLGQAPGVSPDGQTVVFAGDLSSGGAATINAAQANWDYGNGVGKLTLATLKAGPGIFASVKTSKGRVVIRVAGVAGNGILDPGETYDDLNTNGVFDPDTEIDSGLCTAFPFQDARVGVDSGAGVQRGVTICYLAQNAQGEQGIYSNRLSLIGTGKKPFAPETPGFLVVGRATRVVEAGDTIPGLSGVVQSLGVNDPLNDRDRGDIAFYAKTDTNAGVVRARPVQVVFFDFNPKANFKLNPDSAELFGPEYLNVKAVWDGNMDRVFAEMAPNRADLNGQNAFKTIQNGVVAASQKSFDVLTQNGHSVNVKVLGAAGEAPPVGGPFIRVFIGDGPYSSAHPSQIAGISSLDLFNQKVLVKQTGAGAKVTPVQGSPEIFVDNLFRVGSHAFTNEDPAHPQDVALSDTGTHKITVGQVITAIANTATHEVGHDLGLVHLKNDLDSFMMNSKASSATTDGHPKDEMRYAQAWGETFEAYEPEELKLGGECSAYRLALSVGSDATAAEVQRTPPESYVLESETRIAFKAVFAIDPPMNVVRAAVGVVPTGIADAEPYFVDLGSGDLETLLDQDIDIGVKDKVILVASTDGNGIDVFGVNAGFGGDVGDIDLSDALFVLTDGRIRANVLDHDEDPVASVLAVYRRTPNGDVLLGSVGDPQGNAGPVAKDNQAKTDAGLPVTINVLGNDSDPDGLDATSVAVAAPPSGGVAVPDPVTGKIKYTPVQGFAGIDTFRYTVRDSKGAVSNEAAVTVTVSGGSCYADFTGDGTLDLFDFLAFVNAFNAEDPGADCVSDGTFDLFDFLCFVNAFNAGC